MFKRKCIGNDSVALSSDGTIACSVVLEPDGKIEAIVDQAVEFDAPKYDIYDATCCCVVPGGFEAHSCLVGSYDDHDGLRLLMTVIQVPWMHLRVMQSK